MAFTQTQLDELERAISQGVLEVEYDGKRTRYRTLEQMRSLRREMRRELGVDSSDGRRVHQAETKRGLS